MNKLIWESLFAGFFILLVLPAIYGAFSSLIPNFNPFYFILICIFAIASPPLLIYFICFDPVKKILVNSIDIWSETSGFLLSTHTTHYGKINGKYQIEMKNPYTVKRGDCVFLAKNKLGMKKIITKEEKYEG
jgi:hypothetical protein